LGATLSGAIFIDGEAGTTGLQIREILERSGEFQLLAIDEARRKDPLAKLNLMAQADVVVLCLHDDAARASVALIETLGSRQPRILDASSAHRVNEAWIYGFPELAPDMPARIGAAQRVSNPGCHATGAIALLAPLIGAKIVPSDAPLAIQSVSGYSGGGRPMIEAHEEGRAPHFELYGLGLEHKHVPEIMAHSGLDRRPIFVPSVGNFRQGMLVSIGLHLDMLPSRPKVHDLFEAYQRCYSGNPSVPCAGFVQVLPPSSDGRIDALGLNHSNRLEVRVFGNEARQQAVLVARFDNLGKGASHAAVQNIRLMLQMQLQK
jgi:N-acetyl-gamma-glutamyl-phosphate reductase